VGFVPSDTVQFSELVRLDDDLELDARAYELRRSGRPLKLERIPMELLLLLVEQRGQLVSREQIVERVWGKDVHLATDSSINAAVRKVRRVLKDDSGRPRFIQTISGKGYRFIAPVEDGRALPTQLRNAPPGVAAASAASDMIPASPIRHSGARRWPLLLAIVAILLPASSVYFVWLRSRSSVQPTDRRLMLAVLPFENLTGDPAQDYFSDGLTEEMISQLSVLEPTHLGVIARTSVMRYKNNQEQLGQIGRELGVQYVLEGSVRRDARKVRVSAQLIQMSDQTHLWTRQYDRELSTLLGLQDEIAHEIADEIHLTLGEDRRTHAAGQPRTSESYEAHDLYLKGLYFWNKRTPEGFRDAIKYFQQAIEKDPSYARAYAGLADCYVLLPEYSEIPQAEFMAKARVAVAQSTST
jgi:TolB-like protein/DNA-binding winged helix-turn-helix (wHTH) protein